MSDDDDDDGPERLLGWFALLFAVCVGALMVVGTIYVIHCALRAW